MLGGVGLCSVPYTITTTATPCGCCVCFCSLLCYSGHHGHAAFCPKWCSRLGAILWCARPPQGEGLWLRHGALGTVRGRWGEPRHFGSAEGTVMLFHAVIASGAVPSVKGESCARGAHPEGWEMGWEAQIEPHCLRCAGRRSENEEM